MEEDKVQSGIQPMIFFGEGQCTECGGPLTVVDMETVFLELNQDAVPISEDTIIKCEAVCMHCGKRYPMMRKGLYYVKDNAYNRFMNHYMDWKSNEQRKAEVEKLIPTKDNPFCINQKVQ